MPGYVAEELAIRRGTRAPLIQRTLVVDGTVAAQMRDIVHPDVDLPPADELREAVAAGEMVLDVLVARGVPIAFANTQVRPRLVEPGSRLGAALGATRVTAALEMVEVMHLASGEAVQYAVDLFAPGSVDLHVIRGLESQDWQA